MKHFKELEESQRLCQFLKEKCIEKSERLEELSKEKTRLVMITAHEIKEPLAAIWSNLEIVLKNLVKDDQKKRELIERAYKRTGQLLTLVRDMLELTRIELHPETLTMEIDNLEPIIRDVVDSYRPKAKEQNLSIKLTIEENIPKVKIHKQTIRRVLENLISNAIKYNRPNGEVSINVVKKGTNIEVSVKDTGVGIKPEEIDKLFDIFFRGSAAIGTKREGVGLGLSIVKRIIKAHGGDIWVESLPGKGSKFTFSLPVYKGGNYGENINN